MESHAWAFLGLHRIEDDQEHAVFALDISAVEDPAPLLPPDLGAFSELRMIGPNCRRTRPRSWPMRAG